MSDSFVCPKCQHVQHIVCGDPGCRCHQAVPKGELPLIWTADGNDLACPYCGLVASYDYWAEREMEAYLQKLGVKTLSEAVEKDKE